MTELQTLLFNLDKQNETLARAHLKYLSMEAERKHFEATLKTKMPGKSSVEKTTLTEASPDWLKFQQELAKLEAIYEFQRLKFSILERSWQSAYLEAKLNESLIRKQE